jgi:carboxymethylenebutenolidase
MVFPVPAISIDWMLSGIPPTGKRVEVAMVAVVQFDDDKLAHEHLYWAKPQCSCSLGDLPVVSQS